MTTIYEARARAIRGMPFAAYALMSAEPVATDHELPAPFCADQNWNFYYNPEQLAEYETDTAATSLCLEAVRLLQRHGERLSHMIPDQHSGQQAVQEACAMASEAVAHSILNQSGAIFDEELPIRSLEDLNITTTTYFTPTVERVARRLINMLPPPKPQPPSGQGSSDQDQSEQDQNDAQGQGEGKHQPSDGTLPGDHGPLLRRPRLGMGGSATDGLPRTWEKPQQVEGRHMPLKPDKIDHDRRNTIERKTAEAIVQGLQCGREAGEIMVNWAKQVLGQTAVRRLRSLESLLRSATSYTRGYQVRRYDGRSRRQAQFSAHSNRQMVRPRWREIRPHIMFVLDISGSMGATEVRMGLDYIASVLKSLDMTEYCSLWLGNTIPRLAFTRITPEDVRKLKIECNGGTDMPTVCERSLHKLRHEHHLPEPDLIICVTDGGTRWQDPNDRDVVYKPKQPFVVAYCYPGEVTEAQFHNLLNVYPVPEHMHLTTVTGYEAF